jgi:hypothetical protein
LFTMRATWTWLFLGNRMPNTILASAMDKIVYTFLHNWLGNRVSETLGTARPRRFTMCTFGLVLFLTSIGKGELGHLRFLLASTSMCLYPKYAMQQFPLPIPGLFPSNTLAQLQNY